jgi:hypothetical protein
MEAAMSRILRASLLVGTAALLAACAGETPTSARNTDTLGPRRDGDTECKSGYVIAYENGIPVYVCADTDES